MEVWGLWVLKHGPLVSYPSSLWDSLLLEKDWLCLALRDLREMCFALDSHFGRTLPDDPAMSLAFLRAKDSQLAQMPRKYSRAMLKAQQAEPALHKACTRTALEKAKWEPVTLPAAANGMHFCPFCQKSFTTKAACASHQSSRHGVSTVADTVSGSVCHVCNQQWWSTYRLKEHLRRSQPCRDAWNNADLDAPLPFEATGHRQDKAWRPPVAVAGPQPFWATLRPDNCPSEHSSRAASCNGFTALVREIAVGPQNQSLGAWFLGMHRLYLEHGELLQQDMFVDGSLAADALALCQALPACKPGEAISKGNLLCQLEERHRVWLRKG